MSDAPGLVKVARLLTAHGTPLAAHPASGALCHAAHGAAAIMGRPIGERAILLARDDGGVLAYPPPNDRRTVAALPLMLHCQPDGRYSLGLPGGAALGAVPGGAIEGNRWQIGGWELFDLQPVSDALPSAFALGPAATDIERFVADPASDPGLVASLFARLTVEHLGPLMPAIAARLDYDWIFPFARTVLNGGSNDIDFSTRHHLRGGIDAHGWSIGEHTYGTPTVVDGQYAMLRIGRYCSIAGEVRIVLANHATDTVTTYPFASLRRFWPSAGPELADHSGEGVVIGNSVWIGAGATILPGATIGDGAIIGAEAVVAGRIPPYAVAVGNPARVARSRFPEPVIERLLAQRWWDWPDHIVDRFIPLLLQGDIELFLRQHPTGS